MDEDGLPPVIVRSGRQFGHIIQGRISLETADFPEVVHRMGGVGRSSPDSQKENPSFSVPDLLEQAHHLFNLTFIDFIDDLFYLKEIRVDMIHSFLNPSAPVPAS